MFVIANKGTIWVSRERRLSCSRQAEEERSVTILANVRRAMHRKRALLWEHEVHNREDALLVHTTVVCTLEAQNSLEGFAALERACSADKLGSHARRTANSTKTAVKVKNAVAWCEIRRRRPCERTRTEKSERMDSDFFRVFKPVFS